jgi:hypothetical protein
MKDAVNYVNFMPFEFNSTMSDFYTKPLELLHKAECEKQGAQFKEDRHSNSVDVRPWLDAQHVREE